MCCKLCLCVSCVIVLIDVILLNPYPVTAADAPIEKAAEDFPLYGKGNHKNYMVCECFWSVAEMSMQCHYARVAPAEEEPTMDYRPPLVCLVVLLFFVDMLRRTRARARATSWWCSRRATFCHKSSCTSASSDSIERMYTLAGGSVSFCIKTSYA